MGNKPFRVGFFGGSITQGGNASAYENSWAARTVRAVEEQLGVPCVELNASISGTGSEFGVFRIEDQLLRFSPDVIFIEFAVNDSWTAKDHPDDIRSSMDRLIGRIRRRCPAAAVVFVYAALKTIPNASPVHEQVARHYGIPSVDAAAALQRAIDAGEGTWEDFITDECHPGDRGHALYADTVAEALRAHPEWLTTPPRDAASLAPAGMENARIEPPEFARVLGGFSIVPAEESGKRMQSLRITRALRADAPGAALEFEFEGVSFALYHRISRRSGGVRLTVDGRPAGERKFFYRYPSAEYRGEFLTFCMRGGLPAGRHTVRVETIPGEEGDAVEIAGFAVG